MAKFLWNQPILIIGHYDLMQFNYILHFSLPVKRKQLTYGNKSVFLYQTQLMILSSSDKSVLHRSCMLIRIDFIFLTTIACYVKSPITALGSSTCIQSQKKLHGYFEYFVLFIFQWVDDLKKGISLMIHLCVGRVSEPEI